MVKTIPAIILALLLTYTAKSQPRPYAEKEAIWYYGEEIIDGGGFYVTYSCTGDTNLKGFNCSVIKQFFLGTTYLSTVIMYEDSSRVFLYNDSIKSFIKLFDFNLNINDTVRINWHGNASQYVIESKRHNIINGDSIIGMSIQGYSACGGSNTNDSIIQHIGGFSDLIPEFITCNFTWYIMRGLYCFEDSLLGHYSTWIAPRCDYTWEGINPINQTLPQIVIYPNPASTELNLQLPFQEGEIEIIISDMLGQKVIEKDLMAGSNIPLDISFLHPGIYSISVDGENISDFSKFIKE